MPAGHGRMGRHPIAHFLPWHFAIEMRTLALLIQCAYFARCRAALAQLVEHRIRNAGVRCSSHLGGTTTKVHGPRITSQVTESKQQLFRGRSLVDHGVGKVPGILL